MIQMLDHSNRGAELKYHLQCPEANTGVQNGVQPVKWEEVESLSPTSEGSVRHRDGRGPGKQEAQAAKISLN
jgi:hypothetical protein